MYGDQLYKFNNYDITRSEKLDETNTVKLMKTFEELK